MACADDKVMAPQTKTAFSVAMLGVRANVDIQLVGNGAQLMNTV